MSCYQKFVFLCSISFFIITSVVGDGNYEESHSSIPTSRNRTEYFPQNTAKEPIVNKTIEGLRDFLKNSDANSKHSVKTKDNIMPSQEAHIESNEYTTKSSIVPRKGVETKTVKPADLPENEKTINNSNISRNTSTLPDSSKLNKNKNNISSTTQESNIQNTTKRPFKPKPTATVDVEKPFPSMATKTPPIGMPSKINYVTPVVLTFLVGSIFIGFIIYKNGREYWEKRHYSRMDFLIDGMYNE